MTQKKVVMMLGVDQSKTARQWREENKEYILPCAEMEKTAEALKIIEAKHGKDFLGEVKFALNDLLESEMEGTTDCATSNAVWNLLYISAGLEMEVDV